MRFSGYAAIFDHVDRGGDIIRLGAFATALQRGAASIPILFNHLAERPVGRVEKMEEDAIGLRVFGLLSESRWGQESAARISSGALRGLSFGYRVRRAHGSDPRELLDLDLVEISLVGEPMNPLARVDAYEAAA